jgi:hypothetical protein
MIDLGNNIYKVKKNLHVDRNLIISYDTVVATIDGDKIVKLGSFSRTTGKHISQISSMLGIPVVMTVNKKKTYFDKYDFGVDVKIDGAISPVSTSVIFEAIKKATKSKTPYYVVISSIYGEIRKKDWCLLDKSSVTETTIRYSKIMKRFGIL